MSATAGTAGDRGVDAGIPAAAPVNSFNQSLALVQTLIRHNVARLDPSARDRFTAELVRWLQEDPILPPPAAASAPSREHSTRSENP